MRRLNRYVEERAPWQLAKDPADAAELDQTLRVAVEGVRAVSVLLHPYMPASDRRLLDALGCQRSGTPAPGSPSRATAPRLTPLEPLFPKTA